jgi:hypothetical protein
MAEGLGVFPTLQYSSTPRARLSIGLGILNITFVWVTIAKKKVHHGFYHYK